MRYGLDRLLHLGLYKLLDQRPVPCCFENPLEILAFRRR